jgi:hypothetical protein
VRIGFFAVLANLVVGSLAKFQHDARFSAFSPKPLAQILIT